MLLSPETTKLQSEVQVENKFMLQKLHFISSAPVTDMKKKNSFEKLPSHCRPPWGPSGQESLIGKESRGMLLAPQFQVLQSSIRI
jgi:hypothetical protein